jgi:hypothetical protein
MKRVIVVVNKRWECDPVSRAHLLRFEGQSLSKKKAGICNGLPVFVG